MNDRDMNGVQEAAGRWVDFAPGIGLVSGGAIGGLAAVVFDAPLAGVAIFVGGVGLVVGAAVRALGTSDRPPRRNEEPSA